jgi:hypothetical protein
MRRNIYLGLTLLEFWITIVLIYAFAGTLPYFTIASL